jgi:hypothetical protein
MDFVLEVTLGGFRHLVNAIAIYIKLPTMIDTPQPVLFVAPIEKAGQAVGTEFLQQPDPATGIPKGHQIFTINPGLHRSAIRLWELF